MENDITFGSLRQPQSFFWAKNSVIKLIGVVFYRKVVYVTLFNYEPFWVRLR